MGDIYFYLHFVPNGTVRCIILHKKVETTISEIFNYRTGYYYSKNYKLNLFMSLRDYIPVKDLASECFQVPSGTK